MQPTTTDRTATDVLNSLAADGYTGNFIAEPSGKIRLSRDKVVPASEVRAQALYRFEGQSNPGDQSVVVAAEYDDGNATIRGALLLSYGPAGSADDAEVLRHIQHQPSPDRRPRQ